MIDWMIVQLKEKQTLTGLPDIHDLRLEIEGFRFPALDSLAERWHSKAVLWLYLYILILCLFSLFIIIAPPQNVGGGGLYWIRFVASVGRSDGPSPILVRSITPLLKEGFPSNLNDTFTSTRECAEPMLPMCQLKVTVTVKGQIFNKQYYTLCRVRSIPTPKSQA